MPNVFCHGPKQFAARIASLLLLAVSLALTGCGGSVLKGSDRFNTLDPYRPPVEITIVAKTDSNNLRIAYAADQVIFNWEMDESQLRVDGGPASGHHKRGAGYIRPNTFVTIKWIVKPTSQSIYVDGTLRYEHSGDYSQINNHVSIFPARGSVVTVKSVKVKRISE